MDTILMEKRDFHLGYIILNRPDKLNTFNSPLADELDRALIEFDNDPDVRVIIIKGNGKVFSAGIDLEEFYGKGANEYRDWIEKMERPLVRISQLKKPVIAQVHGVAAANGAGLVAASDLATASEDARIGLTAINVGLNCVGPVVPLSRSVGRKRALEMLLSGKFIGAEQALNMGIINRVFPADSLEEETKRFAMIFSKKSPFALQHAKRAFYNAIELEYEKAFEFMNEAFARLCTHEEAKEGIQAFKEKREPWWSIR